ncbi:MAG: hypothetical protein WCT31_05145, partial [Candidatus Micrarchaeia archaeon]
MKIKFLLVPVIILSMVLLLGGCVSQPASNSDTSPVQCAANNGTVETKCATLSPTDAELSQIINNFDNYAENARKDWKVPGMTIAIVKGDKVL